MLDNEVRLDGWKAIANYLKRSRSAVIRWAEEDQLPVRRVGDKPGAAVYAYVHEIETWLKRGGTAPGPSLQTPAPAASPSGRAAWDKPRLAHLRWVSSLGLLLLVGSAVVAISRLPQIQRQSAKPSLPADAAVADTYLKARDEWVTRTPDGLNRALADFSSVIMKDPSFAPAYTGLADTYIAAREYASIPDAIAFPKAEAAARAALGIDPDSAEAQRALGFVAFWGRRDFPTAQRFFLRSLQAAPNDARSHFWWGNILCDAERGAAGLRELRQARLLDPGSRAIETDYAWYQWTEGRDDSGVQDLRDVAAQSPTHSEALKFLAYIDLAKGDYGRYLAEIARFATLQANPALESEVASEMNAFRTGGEKALLAVMAERPWSTDAPYWVPQWRLTAVSLLGRRAEFLSMLRSNPNPASWKGWRWSQLRVARWRNDKEVAAAFAAASGRPPLTSEVTALRQTPSAPAKSNAASP